MPLADHSTPGPLADHSTPRLLTVSPGLLTVSSLPRFGSTPAGKAAGAENSMMVIGSLALMGMPFLTGFYSKDVILEVGYATYSTASHFAYWLGSFAAFCTAFYSIRLLALCFLVEPNGSRSLLLSASEGSWAIGLVLGLLAIPSMFVGYGRDLFIGLGTDFWGNSLFCLPFNLSIIDAEFMSTSPKLCHYY